MFGDYGFNSSVKNEFNIGETPMTKSWENFHNRTITKSCGFNLPILNKVNKEQKEYINHWDKNNKSMQDKTEINYKVKIDPSKKLKLSLDLSLGYGFKIDISVKIPENVESVKK